MNQLTAAKNLVKSGKSHAYRSVYIKVFLAGLLFPLGFSPYNFSGLTILSLAIFYALICQATIKSALLMGFVYGLALFGFGVSWVIVSIHDYGSLNYIISALVTLAFVAYLSIYTAISGAGFRLLNPTVSPLLSSLVFASVWILTEVARSNFMTGFPWLLAGTSQSDSPLRFLAPIFGNYGVGFTVCLAAALLANSMRQIGFKRIIYLILFVLLIILPTSLKTVEWTKTSKKPVSVAVIQANLSMRDKWDESLFWQLLSHYENKTSELLANDLIVMPESAIPLPSSYVEDFLNKINAKANLAKTAVVLGILRPTNSDDNQFKNAIMTLGRARGEYAKRHLVPFGEYIPQAFKLINKLFLLPEPGLLPGNIKQGLIQIGRNPVASLICYEIAYPALLRQQLPNARWIISVSDNGWFGHSLASYQQQQMAQMLSLQTGRFQVVANNDGLSSIINPQGNVIDSLPPFKAGVLQSKLYGATGATPWVKWGDNPVLLFCLFIIIFTLLLKIILKRSH